MDLSLSIDRAAMEIQDIIYGFHMPLFMFISGFLFWFTQMKKGKPYWETVSSKLIRLGIPFLVFSLFTLFLKFLFNPLMNRQVEFSFRQITDVFFITNGGNPLGEMWFIFTLLALFFFYPLYSLSFKMPIFTYLLLFAAILLNLFFTRDIDFLCISQIAKYLVFFYAGIIVSRFEFYKKLDSWLMLIIFSVIFAFSWIFKIPAIIIAFSGIAASFSLCLCISRYLPGLFSSFRNYTYQIFLIGIFPQMFVRFIYTKKVFPGILAENILYHNIAYILLYLVSIFLALYISTIASKIIEKFPVKLIRLFFGLS
jgi:hypothetical protein